MVWFLYTMIKLNIKKKIDKILEGGYTTVMYNKREIHS